MYLWKGMILQTDAKNIIFKYCVTKEKMNTHIMTVAE